MTKMDKVLRDDCAIDLDTPATMSQILKHLATNKDSYQLERHKLLAELASWIEYVSQLQSDATSSAQISASHEATKAAMAKHLEQLKESLQDLG